MGTSTTGCAVKDHSPKQKMTWKKMMRPVSEKFNPDNIAY